MFNYRLSRARRVVENAFGLMANRFRVLLTQIALEPEKVDKLVLATCCLHNFLREEIGQGYMSAAEVEDAVTNQVIVGTWRKDPQLEQAALNPGTNPTKKAKAQRALLTSYVMSDIGAVPWQWDRC